MLSFGGEHPGEPWPQGTWCWAHRGASGAVRHLLRSGRHRVSHPTQPSVFPLAVGRLPSGRSQLTLGVRSCWHSSRVSCCCSGNLHDISDGQRRFSPQKSHEIDANRVSSQLLMAPGCAVATAEGRCPLPCPAVCTAVSPVLHVTDCGGQTPSGYLDDSLPAGGDPEFGCKPSRVQIAGAGSRYLIPLQIEVQRR